MESDWKLTLVSVALILEMANFSKIRNGKFRGKCGTITIKVFTLFKFFSKLKKQNQLCMLGEGSIVLMNKLGPLILETVQSLYDGGRGRFYCSVVSLLFLKCLLYYILLSFFLHLQHGWLRVRPADNPGDSSVTEMSQLCNHIRSWHPGE